MKVYFRVLIVSILVISLFAAGCGGGGGGSSYVAPAGESLSGSVVLPADAAEAITKNIVTNVSYEGMKVYLFDMNDNDIVSPVELGSTGAFSFPDIPAGSNYQLVVITPAGKRLLRKHIDAFSEARSSVNINSESTALAILVKQSNFEKSETSLSEVISPAVISSLAEKITEWLKGNSPSTENDVFAVVIAVVGESEIKKIIDNVPDPVIYSVVYDGNGNTGGAVPIDSLTYQQSATITVKDNTGSLVKTGFTFIGWNTAADGSGTSYTTGETFAMGTANVTLYAKWSLIPTYNITYNGNGNTSGSAPTDNLAYQQGATVTVKNNIGNLVKTGYTFVGWNIAVDGSGTSYAVGSTFAVDAANVTLYAKWSLIPTYNVTYNGNGNIGGSVPTDSLTYQQSATVTVKGNTGSLAKTGYTFFSWNTQADGSGTGYAAGSTFAMGTTGVTLYAQWSKNPTLVSGIINANTTWSLANSPYELTAKVQIANGSTLTIEPGVAIYGKGLAIEVFGILKALGNTNNRIKFWQTNIVPGKQDFNISYFIDLDYLYFTDGAIHPTIANSVYGSINLRRSIIENVSNMYLIDPVNDCYIEQNIFIRSGGINVGNKNIVYIRNNVFIDQAKNDEATYAIRASIGSGAVIKYNSFLSKDKIALSLNVFYKGSMDGTENYWNTTDSDEIAAMIFDKNADLNCFSVIGFEPFLSAPHQDTPDPTPYL